jgi:hypothetical protein
MNMHDFMASSAYKENRESYITDICEIGCLLRSRFRATLSGAQLKYPGVTIRHIETKHWLTSTFHLRLEGKAHDLIRVIESMRAEMMEYI